MLSKTKLYRVGFCCIEKKGKKNIVELNAIETAIIRLSATLTEVVFITTINGKLFRRRENSEFQ